MRINEYVYSFDYVAMKLYGFNLDYENSYQKWSFQISHKVFQYEDGEYRVIDGKVVSIDEDKALQFEKLFSRHLKIAYVDLLSAEKADLEIREYEVVNSAVIVHKVVWRHMNNMVTYIVYDTASVQAPRHLSQDECRELLSVFGIPIF